MPDRRATIDTMNKVLDGLFGKRSYSKGSVDAIPVGQRQYKDDLKMLSEAGMTEEQLLRLMNFAQVSPTSQKMIKVKDNVKTNQRPIITNQKEVSKISNTFINQHTRDALVTTNTEVNKYSERAVKDIGYFARLKKLMASPAKLKKSLEESFVRGNKFSGRDIWEKPFKELGSQIGLVHSGVAHNLKFIEELNRIGSTFDQHRANVQANRQRGGQSWENVAPMLGRIASQRNRGGTNWSAATMLGQFGSRPSSKYITPQQVPQVSPTTPIKLPSNPAASTQRLAAQFVAEQKRQQAMKQASGIGQSLARSNFLKSLARQNKSSTSSVPSLNFIPSRGTHQPTMMDRLSATKTGRWIGSKSDQAKRIAESIGFGLGAGAVSYGGYLATQYGPQAIDALSGGLAHLASGFFAKGGSVPRYNIGTPQGINAFNPDTLFKFQKRVVQPYTDETLKEVKDGILNYLPVKSLDKFFNNKPVSVIPCREDMGGSYSYKDDIIEVPFRRETKNLDAWGNSIYEPLPTSEVLEYLSHETIHARYHQGIINYLKQRNITPEDALNNHIGIENMSNYGKSFFKGGVGKSVRSHPKGNDAYINFVGTDDLGYGTGFVEDVAMRLSGKDIQQNIDRVKEQISNNVELIDPTDIALSKYIKLLNLRNGGDIPSFAKGGKAAYGFHEFLQDRVPKLKQKFTDAKLTAKNYGPLLGLGAGFTAANSLYHIPLNAAVGQVQDPFPLAVAMGLSAIPGIPMAYDAMKKSWAKRGNFAPYAAFSKFKQERFGHASSVFDTVRPDLRNVNRQFYTAQTPTAGAKIPEGTILPPFSLDHFRRKITSIDPRTTIEAIKKVNIKQIADYFDPSVIGKSFSAMFGKKGLATGGSVPRYMSGNDVKYRHFQMGKPFNPIANNILGHMDTVPYESSADFRIYAALEHLKNQRKGNAYHGVMMAHTPDYFPVGGLSYTDLGPKVLHMSDLGSTMKGVGSTLFDNLVNFGTKSGFKKLTWDSLNDPKTLDFYDKRGTLKSVKSLSYERDLTKPFKRADGGSIPSYVGGTPNGMPNYSSEQLNALKAYISDSKPINAAIMKGESHPIYEILKSMAVPLSDDVTAYKGLSSQWKEQLGPLREGKTVKGLNALMSLTPDVDEAMGYVEGDRANQMKMLAVTLNKGTSVIHPPSSMMLPNSSEMIALINGGNFKLGNKRSMGDEGTLFDMVQQRASGGQIPSFAYGGDPLRNIHLTKSPDTASSLINNNVVNSLQSTANSTGIYGLLQSMVKSGSNDASFRGLLYRKGLNTDDWMEKVHQMKLDSASNFMTGYFANGGNVPRFDIGGDTFVNPLAQGPNSQVAQNAVKRLQLLRIRAQAGNRLANLRQDAQLGMQLGNTSLFRSPNTAAGVMNARVIRNLESIFSGQKLGKFAYGGNTLNNPIRVSDGELGIPRGMVDKIGLSALRKINAGDMSALKGFSTGGMFEFDGPGTGTSDSILTDADRGPKGADASDIGFIIRRTSSDRLKSVIGRAMGGMIPGYAGGDDVEYTDQKGNAIPAQNMINSLLSTDPLAGYKSKDESGGYKYQLVRKHFKKVIDLLPERTETFGGSGEDLAAALRPFIEKPGLSEGLITTIKSAFENMNGSSMGFTDVTKNLFSNKELIQGIIDNAGKQHTGNINKIFGSVHKGMQQAYGYKPADVADIQHTQQKEEQVTEEYIDTKRKEILVVKDTLENLAKLNKSIGTFGRYAGQIDWTDQGKTGDRHATNVLGMDEMFSANQQYLPGEALTSQGLGAKNFLGGFARSFKGFWTDVNANMMGYGAESRMKTNNVATIQRVVGGDYAGDDDRERSYMAQNAHDAEGDVERITQRFVDAFAGVFGERTVKNSLEFNRQKKVADTVIDVGVDDKGNRNVATVRRDIDELTIGFGALIDEARARGVNTAEVGRIAQGIVQPTTEAKQGVSREIIDADGVKQTVKTVDEATVSVSRFDEKVKGTAHNERLMYKFGDAMRGLSWRFASLGMSAMGVYFSIQGLMMTFQQGLGAITTPLADIESLFKNIGMSTAFGDGIMNASKAMDQLGVSTEDMVDGWKNLTNIQGTISTLFGSIGAKVFGGEEGKQFADQLLTGITDAFDELDNQDIGSTIRDLLNAIVESLPAIVPAIKSITSMLQILADNKFLVEWGAQLMMISLVIQPVASGMAALVTAVGGVATISSEFYSLSKAIGASATAMRGLSAAMIGVTMEVVLLLAAWEAVARIIEFVTNSHIDLKPSSMIAGALGFQGFANGGVVQSEGYDMVPGHPDDTIITAKAGEVVINPNKRQHFADAPTGLRPSATYENPAEKTYQTARTAGLMEDGNRTAASMDRMMQDTKDANAWNVNVLNWPALWGDGSGEGNELPFDIGSLLPEKLFGFQYNTNPDAGNPNTNAIATGASTNPLGWLVNIISTSVKDNSKDNSKDTTKDNSKDTGTTTTVEPNDSLLAYIKDTFKAMYESIKRAGDAIVQSVQDTVEVITSGLMGALVSLMDTASRAAEVIGNITVALSKIDVIAPLKSAGSAIVEGIKSIPQTVAGLPSSIVEGGMNFLTNGLNTANAQDIKYHHAGYRKWGDVTDYGPIPGQVKNTGFWDRFKNGKYVYPQQPSPMVDVPNKPSNIPGVGQTQPSGSKQQRKFNEYGKQMWTGWEKWILDFPVDLTPVMRDIVTSDSNPYAAALSMSSAITENALVGYGMGGMQRAAQSAPAWLSKLIGKGNVRNAISSGLAGKVPAALGAFGTEAMGLINHPGVVIGASLVEGQQAMDKWTAGQDAASFKDSNSKYNQATGLVTGGFVDAAFGKGIEVLADHFGKSEDVMRNEVNNSWASDLGLNTLYEFIAGGGNIEKGKETTGDFGEWLKGGNLKVSDLLKQIIPDNLKVENVPLIGSVSAEGVATGINENVYDLLATLGNLNVRSLTGAGTSFIGMGAALGELGGNTAQMLGENGMMAPYLGMSMLPFVGPFAAAMMMPKTTEWLSGSEYGSENIDIPSNLDEIITTDIPNAFTEANVPIVSGLDTVNQSIVDGNAATVAAINGINISVVQQPVETAKQALRLGGSIGGAPTSTIDDKMGVLPNGDKIAVDEGEFIVRREVAENYGPQLQELNATNQWPKGYSAGGKVDNKWGTFGALTGLTTGTIWHKQINDVIKFVQNDIAARNMYQQPSMDVVNKAFKENIVDEIAKSYKPEMGTPTIRYAKGIDKGVAKSAYYGVNQMDEAMKQALSVSKQSIRFGSDLSFGGKVPVQEGATSASYVNKGVRNIAVAPGLGKEATSAALQKELSGAILEKASTQQLAAFEKSLLSQSTKMPSITGNIIDKVGNIKSKIPSVDNIVSTFKGMGRKISDGISGIKLPSIDRTFSNVVDKVGSSIKSGISSLKTIKLPSVNSIEKTMVDTFNKVGNIIDDAASKGVKAFSVSANNISKNPLLTKAALKMPNSAMFTPADFQRENELFAKEDYKNNPTYYQDMWARGESGISSGSPIEQLITGWNKDVAKFIYGNRDYLKNERESYLGNQQNSFANIDIGDPVGVYDFNKAIKEATKSIQEIPTVMNYSHNQIGSYDVAMNGAYNSSEAFKNFNYGHNQVGGIYDRAMYGNAAEVLSNPWYGNYERPWTKVGNAAHGEAPLNMPNMDSGWWTVNTDPTKAYSEAQKALNDVYIGKYGGYISDPNGNKYGVQSPEDSMAGKYYGEYDAKHPAPEYIGGIAPLGSSLYGMAPISEAFTGAYNATTDTAQILGTPTMENLVDILNMKNSAMEAMSVGNINTNSITDMSQNSKNNVEQSIVNEQVQSTQPIIVQITVSGDELATKGYVEKTLEVQVPNIMRQTQPRTF